jgi:signal transduction histidine kinase
MAVRPIAGDARRHYIRSVSRRQHDEEDAMAGGAPERYRSLEALRDAAVYVDDQGQILAGNDAFQELWILSGAGLGRCQGSTLLQIFVEDDRKWVRDTLTFKALARWSSRAPRLAGSLASMTTEFKRIRRRSSPGTFWLVTLRAGPTLDAYNDDAFRATLTAGVVHDLRAPLQAVLGWTSLLKRTHGDPDRTEHALAIVERNANLQKALLDHLLEILQPSRTRLMRSPLQPQHINLSQLVEAEVHSVQPLADERGVSVLLRDDSSGIVVDGTEVHLRRVVANLVGNALKFTPPGGTVECRLWRSAEWAGIVVRDTGRGIDRELLPRVFDAFRQASDRAPDQEGLGLGLTVVRQLVELHGGTVTAASAGCGCGSTFTVLLPAVPRLAPGEGVQSASVGVSPDGPHSEDLPVLPTTTVRLSHCSANPIACADRTVGAVIRDSRFISEAL